MADAEGLDVEQCRCESGVPSNRRCGGEVTGDDGLCDYCRTSEWCVQWRSEQPGLVASPALTETPCPKSDDRQHCDHWYDDVGPCCACGDDTGAGLSDAAPGRKPGERV